MSRDSRDAIVRSRPSALNRPSSMATSTSRLLNADTGSIVIFIAVPLPSWVPLWPDVGFVEVIRAEVVGHLHGPAYRRNESGAQRLFERGCDARAKLGNGFPGVAAPSLRARPHLDRVPLGIRHGGRQAGESDHHEAVELVDVLS